MTQAHTQAHTPTLEHAMSMLKHADTAANAGLRKMRVALAASEACAALGLAPRTPAPAPAKPAAPRVSTRKPAPAARPARDADAPEQMHGWRVGVLVEAGESAQTCVWVAVQAAGLKRACKQARADAFRAGHKPMGVCAVLREDAPTAVLAAAA